MCIRDLITDLISRKRKSVVVTLKNLTILSCRRSSSPWDSQSTQVAQYGLHLVAMRSSSSDDPVFAIPCAQDFINRN